MAAINAILKIERENTDKIHLFREGLFLKAYQRSALLFLRNVKDYKVLKMSFKAADSDVVLLGFPSSLLDTLVKPGQVEQIGEGHLCISCEEPLNDKEYDAWFASVPFAAEKKPKKKDTPELFAPLPDAEPRMSVRIFEPPAVSTTAHEQIVREIRSFQLENSTPMECMMFVNRLKGDIQGCGVNGGL
jgi:hypothetical protein